jgi:hypothetical protein
MAIDMKMTNIGYFNATSVVSERNDRLLCAYEAYRQNLQH